MNIYNNLIQSLVIPLKEFLNKNVLCRYVTRKAKTIEKFQKLVVTAHQRHKDEKLLFGGVLETKIEKKKREKLQRKEGKALSSVGATAPDSEAYWMANSSPKDLKLYRKTVSGRYKEVDNDKLLEKLKSDKEKQRNIKDVSNNGKKIIMADIIVRRLTSVPMLASNIVLETSPNHADKGCFPSVTRILSGTMSDDSKAALERWKQKMIAELGEEGFLILNKEQLSFGARFHASVRRFLEGADPMLDNDQDKVWNSVQTVFPHINHVQLLESAVFHSKLKYKGVVDCVASYRGTPMVIEWKVSQKSKPQLSATYDAPLQLSAYLGALSYDVEHRMDLRNGLVVVAYKDGAPADVFPLNEEACLKYWTLWLKRLQLYWQTSPVP